MWAPSIGRVLVLGWLTVEVLAYIAFFSFFSVGAGLLLGIGSIGLGVLTLRLLGRKITAQATAELMDVAAAGYRGSFPIALLGAFLLLLPGFVSDLIGVALVLAGSKALLIKRPPQRGKDIDLEPHEWTRGPDDRRPR